MRSGKRPTEPQHSGGKAGAVWEAPRPNPGSRKQVGLSRDSRAVHRQKSPNNAWVGEFCWGTRISAVSVSFMLRGCYSLADALPHILSL